MAGAADVLGHRPSQYPVTDGRNGGHHFLRNIALVGAGLATLGVGGYEADKKTDWFDRLFHPTAQAAVENRLTAKDYERIVNEYISGSGSSPITASEIIKIEKIPRIEMGRIAGEQRFKTARDFMRHFDYETGYAIRRAGGMTYYGFAVNGMGAENVIIHTAGPTPLEARKR